MAWFRHPFLTHRLDASSYSFWYTTASRLSTKGMPLDKIRNILGQVDEKTTLSYIYNPNTEQETLNIMNEALKKSDRKNIK